MIVMHARCSSPFATVALIAALFLASARWMTLEAQIPDGPPPEGNEGPPGFRPGGPGGRGGFGGGPGFMQEELKLVKRFDQNGNQRLDLEERKAAREQLAQERPQRGGPGGRRGFGRGGAAEPITPGPKISPADITDHPATPFYDGGTLRTLFLEFENADWEQELEDFNNTDVEVPATLTVDGKSYPEVGVHFRGASSFMMVRAGQKRSLNVSVDFVHEGQNVLGHRTLNLLNAHEDPSFLRTVLFYRIAREYLPAPQANLVRLVINGEYWGVYVSSEQFNKDFVKTWFGTTEGARWKVPGSPNGRGSLAYLGAQPNAYKGIYELKSKNDPKAWTQLIRLCQTLNETPPDQLEAALAPLLDIDRALRFLALENVLINNDGYWVRTSDYSLYTDLEGRFHVIPNDANETFALPGGPGFGGGPGGRGGLGGPGRFGPGGFGGPDGPGPGAMLAPRFLEQGDRNADETLTATEMAGLADAWFAKLDETQRGRVDQEQVLARFDQILPPPGGPRAADGPGFDGPPRGGAFGPARFLGLPLFAAADGDRDGTLTRAEWKKAFETWAREWDASQKGALDVAAVGAGLNKVLVSNEGARGGGRGNARGPGGPGGPGGLGGPGGPGFGGPGGGGRVNGVELDPLLAASDPSKPLISKLLAVPALRTRYLQHVRDIATTWLDWNRLGPIAESYHALIREAVKADTRKLVRTEEFEKSLTQSMGGGGGFGPGGPGKIGLKTFADGRRAYLLNHPEIKTLEAVR